MEEDKKREYVVLAATPHVAECHSHGALQITVRHNINDDIAPYSPCNPDAGRVQLTGLIHNA
jgi:hypothetical protein